MLRIRRRSVLGVAAGIAVLAIAGLVGLAFATGQAARQLEILRLRTENRLLASSVEALDERAGALDEALDDLAVRGERFRLLAGLPLLDPEIQEVGVGGPAPIDNEREEFFRLRPDLAQETYGTRYELDRMLRRAKLLEAGLAEAEDSLAFSHEALLARPSIWPVAGQEAWLSSGCDGPRHGCHRREGSCGRPCGRGRSRLRLRDAVRASLRVEGPDGPASGARRGDRLGRQIRAGQWAARPLRDPSRRKTGQPLRLPSRAAHDRKRRVGLPGSHFFVEKAP